MIKYKRLAIKLNDEQKERLDFIFTGLEFLYNYYIMYNKKLYYENKDNPDKYTFMTDTEFRKFVTYELMLHDKYKWLKQIPAVPRNELIFDCFNAYKRFFNKKANPPKIKTRKNRIKSYYLREDSIRFYDDYKYIKILGIDGKMEVLNPDYIRNFKYNRIISGRIIKRTNKNFFISLKLDVDDSDKTYQLSSKISIAFGLQNYLTLYDGNNIFIKENKIFNNPKLLKIDNRINQLNKITNHKLNENKKARNLTVVRYDTCNSNRIEKIYDKIRNLYYKKENFINDFLYKMISEIINKFQPKIIIIERNQLMKILMTIESPEICDVIHDSKFYFFTERLKRYCKEIGTEIRIPKKKDEYYKKCSKCGYKIENVDLSNLYFQCPKCGYKIYKTVNNAMNLYNIKDYKIE